VGSQNFEATYPVPLGTEGDRIVQSRSIPDGTEVNGCISKGMPKVVSIHQNGTQKRPLLNLESMFDRYSPDGSRIAVVKQREGKIEVIDLSGKKLFDFSMP